MSEDAAIDARLWAAACEEALTALRYALHWELPEPGWDEVASVIGDMARAIVTHDADLLAQSARTLESYSPLRISTRQGEDSRDSAPVAVKEQIADTVKDLIDSTQDTKRR